MYGKSRVIREYQRFLEAGGEFVLLFVVSGFRLVYFVFAVRSFRFIRVLVEVELMLYYGQLCVDVQRRQSLVRNLYFLMFESRRFGFEGLLEFRWFERVVRGFRRLVSCLFGEYGFRSVVFFCVSGSIYVRRRLAELGLEGLLLAVRILSVIRLRFRLFVFFLDFKFEEFLFLFLLGFFVVFFKFFEDEKIGR